MGYNTVNSSSHSTNLSRISSNLRFPPSGLSKASLLTGFLSPSLSNFNRYVRFNTMRAIVLDVLLIFPDLLERSFNPRDGFGLDVVMSLDSTVFLFLLVSLIYGFSTSLFGLIPRLPLVAEAADRQVL